MGSRAAASQRAAKLARIRYRGGVDSFVNVLDAERAGWEYAFGRDETE